MEGNIRKLLPPCPVNLVSEPGVVRLKFRAVRQNLVGKLVKILDLCGEPGHCLSIVLHRDNVLYQGRNAS